MASDPLATQSQVPTPAVTEPGPTGTAAGTGRRTLTAQTPVGSSRDPLSLPRLPWDNTVTQTHLVSKAPTFHHCPQTQWMVFSNESAVLREGRHHVTFVTPAKAREVFTERAREGEETDRQMTRKKEGQEYVQHSRGPGRRDKRYPAQRDAPAPRAPTTPATVQLAFDDDQKITRF